MYIMLQSHADAARKIFLYIVGHVVAHIVHASISQQIVQKEICNKIDVFCFRLGKSANKGECIKLDMATTVAFVIFVLSFWS